MQTVNNIIEVLRITSFTLCGLVYAMCFFTMMTNQEPYEKQKTLKHIKNATIFLVLVISVFPIKDMIVRYFGKDIGIGTLSQSDVTFGNIYDYDKYGRNTYLIDGKLYVAYNIISKDDLIVEGLKEFYDCQGVTGGLLANYKYIRYINSNGTFPLGTLILYDENPPTTIIKPSEYKIIHNNSNWSDGAGGGGGFSGGGRWSAVGSGGGGR